MTQHPSGFALRRRNGVWQFTSEAALETFLFERIEQALGFTPVARQFEVLRDKCDILALDPTGELVILELKNDEDWQLVQQLTRYYANLTEARPVIGTVGDKEPSRLIAVAPGFHKRNFIDRRFSTLKIEFIEHSIQKTEAGFELVLRHLEQGNVWNIPIPYQELDPESIEVAAPPEVLQDWLGACSKAEQEGFLRLRRMLLSADERIQEMPDKKIFRYGTKGKQVAEIALDHRTHRPVLFLWLQIPNIKPWWNRAYYPPEKLKYKIGRCRIWTNGTTISHLDHVPEKFGEKHHLEFDPLNLHKAIRKVGSSTQYGARSMDGYLLCPRNQKEKVWFRKDPKQYSKPLPRYQPECQVPDYWKILAELAIEQWQERG